MVGMFTSTLASATTCTSDKGGSFAVAVGTKTIARDIAIGQLLPPKVGQTAPYYPFVCISDSRAVEMTTVTFTVAAAPVAGYTDVYPTNIAGFGVRYNFASALVSITSCNTPYDQHIEKSVFTLTCPIPAGNGSNRVLIAGWGTSVEFVKTGDIAGGELVSIPAVTMSYTLNGKTVALNNMYTGAMSGRLIVDNGCKYVIPSVVNLGSISAAHLQRSKPSAYVPFSLNINCAAGAKIKVRFDAAAGSTVISATNGFISTAKGGAQGVSLQFRKGESEVLPLQRDIDYGALTYPNDIKFAARMVPSFEEDVTGGKVSGGLTVTFSPY